MAADAHPGGRNVQTTVRRYVAPGARISPPGPSASSGRMLVSSASRNRPTPNGDARPPSAGRQQLAASGHAAAAAHGSASYAAGALEHQLAERQSLRLAQLSQPSPVALPPGLLFRSLRLGVSAVLDRLAAVAQLLQQHYWINDPSMYRPALCAAGIYQWVRYWNDALLVDAGPETVIDVIPGFFW